MVQRGEVAPFSFVFWRFLSCEPQRHAAQFAALRRPLWAGTIGKKTTFLKIFRIVNIRGHKELNKTITFVAIVKVKDSISRF